MANELFRQQASSVCNTTVSSAILVRLLTGSEINRRLGRHVIHSPRACIQ